MLPFLALYVAFVASAAAFQIELKRTIKPDIPQNISLKANLNQVYRKYAKNAKIYHNKTGTHYRGYNGTELSRRASGKTYLNVDRAWAGVMDVGTPSKRVSVVFDTGSADIVMDKDDYNPKKSITAKDLKTKFAFSYADRSVEGDIYSDVVTIGHAKAKDVPIGRGLENYNDEVTGGLFGLSFPTISAFDTDLDVYADAVKKQHLIHDNVFQFTMRPKGKATLNVGKVDWKEGKGGFGWLKVDRNDGYWKAGMKINGKETKGIVDSGTTLIVGPNDQVKEVLDSIKGVEVSRDDEGNWQGKYDCNNPPKIVFEVAGKKLQLQKDGMWFAYAGDRCTLGIFGSDAFNDWIYGDTFFQSTSIIFDFDNERMGFAQMRN